MGILLLSSLRAKRSNLAQLTRALADRDCLKAPVSWRDQLVEVQPR
jgi:hypothetical protein